MRELKHHTSKAKSKFTIIIVVIVIIKQSKYTKMAFVKGTLLSFWDNYNY